MLQYIFSYDVKCVTLYAGPTFLLISSAVFLLISLCLHHGPETYVRDHTHTHTVNHNTVSTMSAGDVMRILSMSRLNRILRIYKMVHRYYCHYIHAQYKILIHICLQPLAFNYLESQVGRPVGTITYAHT